VSQRSKKNLLEVPWFRQPIFDRQSVAERHDRFEQSAARFLGESAFTQQVCHFQLACRLLTMRRGLPLLGFGQRRRLRGGRVGRQQRSNGPSRSGNQPELDQAIESLIRRPVDNFQSYRRQRIGLSGRKVFFVQAAQFLEPLGGIPFDNDV